MVDGKSLERVVEPVEAEAAAAAPAGGSAAADTRELETTQLSTPLTDPSGIQSDTVASSSTVVRNPYAERIERTWLGYRLPTWVASLA